MINSLSEMERELKNALADTDYTQLPDVMISNKDDFIFYRASLRKILKDKILIASIPTPPEPVWISA